MEKYYNCSQVIYPIQDVGLTPTSKCPTWRRRFPWNTRLWAKRQLRLARAAKDWELDIGMNQRESPVISSCYVFDEDEKECTMLEVIPLDDIEKKLQEDADKANRPKQEQDEPPTKKQTKKQRDEQRKRDRLQNLCAICHAPFYGEQDPLDHCSEGGEIARRIRCGNHHVFGLECIVQAWKYSIDDPYQDNPDCPVCRTPLNIRIVPPRTYERRLELMMRHWHDRYRDCYRPGGPAGPWPISFETYAAVAATTIALLPMFMVVSHCMNIHNSKHGVMLPREQIAAMLLVATFLQVVWFGAMLLTPVVLPIYVLWKVRASIFSIFRDLFVSVVSLNREVARGR